jgi:hypothetical protein
MASKIVPHTIFLGTALLASFLSHFSFGAHGETDVEEVYNVFTTLRREKSYHQILATTRIMGILGRRLGKLPQV